MVRYLLDSNTASYAIKGNVPSVRERLLRTPMAEVGISVSGKPMGNMDMLIAVHELAVEAVLVTHDRVFRRVKALRIEDWRKP